MSLLIHVTLTSNGAPPSGACGFQVGLTGQGGWFAGSLGQRMSLIRPAVPSPWRFPLAPAHASCQVSPAAWAGFARHLPLAVQLHCWLHSPMCDFISIAVPKEATDAVSKRRRRYYALSPHDNPTLRTHLPPGYSTWVLTKGGCSCELCVSIGTVPRKASATLDVILRDDASEILQEIVEGLDRVFVYIHHYRGDISTEQLPVSSRERWKIDAFGAQTQFRRDSLIELTRR